MVISWYYNSTISLLNITYSPEKYTCITCVWLFVSNQSKSLCLVYGYNICIIVWLILFCLILIYTTSCLGTDHLTWRGGGYGFLFRWEFYFRTTQELEYLFSLSHKARNFFPEFNIRLYDKNSESDFIFSSTKIRIFFPATLGIRIFF